MSRRLSHGALVVLAITLATTPALGARRHHHDVKRALQAADASPRPHQFYPEEVENGVRGNLPFNNQMRKFSDPLSANGGGH